MARYQLRQWALPLACECAPGSKIHTFELRNSGGRKIKLTDTPERVTKAYLVCPHCNHAYEITFMRLTKAGRDTVAIVLEAMTVQLSPLQPQMLS